MKKFVSWRRVSTIYQKKTGLGLESQKNIINHFVQIENGTLIADFCEVYTGKNLNGCTELRKAISFAKENNAILIIAKTDRFRNTVEALQIYDEMGEGNIYFCDIPHTDKFTLTLFFALAEREALLVSIRTKAALAVNKAKGILSGRANSNYQIKDETKEKAILKGAITKNKATIESEEFACFCRILRKVIPILNESSTDEELFFLNWTKYRTSFVLTKDYKAEIKELMQEANRNNNKLFIGIDFTNANFYQYISSRVQATFNSISKYKEYNNL